MITKRDIFATEYTTTVFSLVRGFFLLGCALGILLSLAAVADQMFVLGWGYGWRTVPYGILFSVLSFGGYLFVRWIGKALNGFFEKKA